MGPCIAYACFTASAANLRQFTPTLLLKQAQPRQTARLPNILQFTSETIALAQRLFGHSAECFSHQFIVMYTITFAGITAAISELHDHGISRCLPLLEERLYLTFGCLPQRWKQRTKGEKESRSIYEARYKNNRAQRTYLTALNKNPYFFLPYLLVVSPRQVKTQAATKLLEHVNVKDCQFKLAAEAKKTLDEIADRKGFKNHPRYQTLILTFFQRKIPQGE